MYRTSILLLVVVLLIGAASIGAQEAPPSGPPVGRPPLIECVDGESIPCVEIVTQAEQLEGTWRRYFGGAEAMAFVTYDAEGNGLTTLDLESPPILASTITFQDGLAYAVAPEGPGIPEECVTPGVYEVRRIRLGDQPVALTLLLVEDECQGRISDTSRPMLYYTGAEVQEPSARANIRAQALVPCPEEAGEHPYPCDVVATSPEGVAGIWRQYMGNPAFGAPNGMGFTRFNPDGSFQLGVTAEDTSAADTALPTGSISFDGTELTLMVDGDAPPECKSASYRFRVIRVGDQPVALVPEPISDECVRRRDGDMAEAQIWVEPAASHAG